MNDTIRRCHGDCVHCEYCEPERCEFVASLEAELDAVEDIVRRQRAPNASLAWAQWRARILS